MENEVTRSTAIYQNSVRPYGLPGWNGRKFLDFFQVDPLRQSVTKIWLGHIDGERESSSCSYVLVGTFADSYLTSAGVDASAEVAHEALLKLVNLSLPHPAVARPDGFQRRLVNYVDDQARQHRQWPYLGVSVDGQTQPCRYWAFAEGVAACVSPQGNSPFAIIAGRTDLATLTVETLSTTADYGFDYRGGLRFDNLSSGSLAPQAEGYHDDFRVIL